MNKSPVVWLSLIFIALTGISRAQSQSPIGEMLNAPDGTFNTTWGAVGTAWGLSSCATLSNDPSCSQNPNDPSTVANDYSLIYTLNSLYQEPTVTNAQDTVSGKIKNGLLGAAENYNAAAATAIGLAKDYLGTNMISNEEQGATDMSAQTAGTCQSSPGSLVSDNWLTPGSNCGGTIGNQSIPQVEAVPNSGACSASWLEAQAGNCPALQDGLNIFNTYNNQVAQPVLGASECLANNFAVVPVTGGPNGTMPYSADCSNAGIPSPLDQDAEAAALDVIGEQGAAKTAISDVASSGLGAWQGYLGSLATGDAGSFVENSTSIAGVLTGGATQIENDWQAFAADLASGGVPAAKPDLDRFTGDMLATAGAVKDYATYSVNTLNADLPGVEQALLPPGLPIPSIDPQTILGAAAGFKTYADAVIIDTGTLINDLDVDAVDLENHPGDAQDIAAGIGDWLQNVYVAQVLGGLEQQTVRACGIVGQDQQCQALFSAIPLSKQTASAPNPAAVTQITAGLLQ